MIVNSSNIKTMLLLCGDKWVRGAVGPTGVKVLLCSVRDVNQVLAATGSQCRDMPSDPPRLKKCLSSLSGRYLVNTDWLHKLNCCHRVTVFTCLLPISIRNQSTEKEHIIKTKTRFHSLCSYDNNGNCTSAWSISPVWNSTELTADWVTHIHTERAELIAPFPSYPSLPLLNLAPPSSLPSALCVHSLLPLWQNPNWVLGESWLLCRRSWDSVGRWGTAPSFRKEDVTLRHCTFLSIRCHRDFVKCIRICNLAFSYGEANFGWT